MGTPHKMALELFEETYGLIAMHATLPCYAMAYYMNCFMKMQLVRAKKDIRAKNAQFCCYNWLDESRDCLFSLFGNKTSIKVTENPKIDTLFSGQPFSQTIYLIPKRKKADYFLKVAHENTVNVEKLIGAIQKIPKISMVYGIAPKELKHKDYLITLPDAN